MCSDNSFKSSFELKNYINKFHDIHDKKIKCKICDFNFGNSFELETHIKSAHEINSKLYTCNKCNPSLSNNLELKDHIKGVHQKKLSQNVKLKYWERNFQKRGIACKHDKRVKL